MTCVENWENQQFTTPLACRPGQIYWKKDPTLCIEAVHPEMVQLRDCAGVESQMFALAEPRDFADPNFEVNTKVSNEGFLIGNGLKSDMCFKIPGNGASLHFGRCDQKGDAPTDTKFQMPDFSKDAE